jgi:indolepyruvate ferredoxin oxidoreductase
MGDSIAANLFMLGYAWQRGRIPLLEASLLRAIELNGVGVESNKKSFLWGRRAAVDLKRVERVAMPTQAIVVQMPQSLENVIKKRVEFLTAYQDAHYAAQYAELVNKVRAAETAAGLGNKLSTAVAKYYFKLMAYKDEYEVARLYTDGRFVEQLKAQFEGEFSVKFNLAPPLFAKKDAKGRLVKAEFGSWMWSAFKLLAKMKGLRGGAFDIFGYTEERKMERALIVEYRSMVEALVAGLTASNHATAVELANLPEQVRGFGHVKEKAVATFRSEKAKLLGKSTAKHAA